MGSCTNCFWIDVKLQDSTENGSPVFVSVGYIYALSIIKFIDEETILSVRWKSPNYLNLSWICDYGKRERTCFVGGWSEHVRHGEPRSAHDRVLRDQQLPFRSRQSRRLAPPARVSSWRPCLGVNVLHIVYFLQSVIVCFLPCLDNWCSILYLT